MLDSRWLDAALFVLPTYPTCRDGLRVLRAEPLGALLASAMLYLNSSAVKRKWQRWQTASKMKGSGHFAHFRSSAVLFT